jgi:hypothetical protein
MESLYLDISDYLPEEEVEAVNKALAQLEEYDYYPSKMNEQTFVEKRAKKWSEAHARS